MLRDLAPERPAPNAPDEPAPPATGMVAAAAAVRGAVVAGAGVLLTAGLALMVWAITPASGPDAAVALRGGVTAFASANLMPVVIGGVALSLPPLLLTAVPVVLLFTMARRGRFQPVGRYQETVAVLTTAGVYGLVVAAITRGYSAPDAVPAGWVWTAFLLALVATAAGTLRGESAWSLWGVATLPGWARVGIRAGMVGTTSLIGAGALVLSCGLILHFGTAVEIAAAAAPTSLDGLGMTMLGLAYLPNAVLAAMGYLSGAGFEIGPGTYSPLATTTADLPGVPLLAAAPVHDGRTMLGLACLALPFLAGYLVARPGRRRLVTRADRVAAAGLGAMLTGLLLSGLAAVAHGGVGAGRWSAMGVPIALFGPVIAVQVGIVAVLVAALTGWRTDPWRLRDLSGTNEAEPDRAATRRGRRGSSKVGRPRRGRKAAPGRSSPATDDAPRVQPAESTGEPVEPGADDATPGDQVSTDEPVETDDATPGDPVETEDPAQTDDPDQTADRPADGSGAVPEVADSDENPDQEGDREEAGKGPADRAG